jgi:hypothetical protein
MAVLVGCDVRNEPEKFTEVLPVVQATTDPVEPHEQLRAYRKALRATSTQLLCSRYVEFQAWHDSSLIELSDETLLQTVYLDIGDLEIGEWEEGKSLKLAYGRKCGILLIDPDSGRFNPVFIVNRIGEEIDDIVELLPEMHPIDRYLETRYEDALGMVETNAELSKEIELWAIETDRVYDQLKLVGDPAQIEKARKKWKEHLVAYDPIIRLASTHGGSRLSQTYDHQSYVSGVLRNHALELNRMLGCRVIVLSER